MAMNRLALFLASASPRRKLEDVDVGPGNMAEMERLLLPLYERIFAEYRPDEPGTPQHDALNFVIYNTFGQLSELQRVQQYALAVFYYSTFAVPNDFVAEPGEWSSAEDWFSFYECQWEGIECEPGGNVVGIFLPNHNVTGSLPIELAFLSSLEVLDLSTNQIYIPPTSVVLGYLTTLRTLLLGDNFFVTDAGLPSSFVFLSSLEKLDLSNNLLQGRLDGSLFGSLTSLTHLQLETNYLSGPLPSEQLGRLSSLYYLYLRNNLLDIDLEAVFQPGRFPEIFSFWIDDNRVGSAMPSTIGQFTTLASLSMANVGLEGSIPIEFAQLSTLRRVWLFQNNLAGSIPSEISAPLLQVFEVHGNPLLSGTMPESICAAMAASDYKSRSVTADCDVVLCSDCCTVCYSSTSNATSKPSTIVPTTESYPTLAPVGGGGEGGTAGPTAPSPTASPTLTDIASSLEPSTGPSEEPPATTPSSFGPATSNSTMVPSLISPTPVGDAPSLLPSFSSAPSQSASPTTQPLRSFNETATGATSSASTYGTLLNLGPLYLHCLSALAWMGAIW